LVGQQLLMELSCSTAGVGQRKNRKAGSVRALTDLQGASSSADKNDELSLMDALGVFRLAFRHAPELSHF